MRFYVEAYGHDGAQILGNLDGQTAWEGKSYTRAKWYRALPRTRTLDNRVHHWRIVNATGYVLERVYPEGK